MGTVANTSTIVDPARRQTHRDEGEGYYDDDAPAYAGMEDRMAGCRDALAHRVLWLLLGVSERARWGAPGADEQATRGLTVDALANLLHCRRESAARACLWLINAGIIRNQRPASPSD
jgi:hypothetical protein